jgi:Flp pilus assembly protein TadG
VPAEEGPLCPPPLASSRRAPAEGPGESVSERGSAVVDFVLVGALIVALLLAVLQIAVYVHLRNVVVASAQEGARYAADADVPTDAGAGRTLEVVGQATSSRTAAGLSCSSVQEVDGSGLALVVVRCTGAVPSLFAPLGDLLPLEATGRAVEEAP